MAEGTTGSIEIEASAEEVMEVIIDFRSYPEWSEVESAEVLEQDDRGRPEVVAFRVSQMGFSAGYTLEYRHEPDHAGISWVTREASGAVDDVRGSYALKEDRGGTRVTYSLRVELSVPVPGLLRRQGERRVVRTALEGLKRRVEQG
jgi:ribosome-associated toxin RatA of RatAB toxin-antitoxin module